MDTFVIKIKERREEVKGNTLQDAYDRFRSKYLETVNLKNKKDVAVVTYPDKRIVIHKKDITVTKSMLEENLVEAYTGLTI